tara:strand:+ start:109 stop:816 length:708 start_codon:yes stop_codon:yes gene_type:complete
MRLAISGTAGQGKSTLIEDFIKKWPVYTTPEKTYRDIISKKSHSKSTNKEVQDDILDFMIDSLTEHGDKENYAIHDRCPLDNMVYSIWSCVKGGDKNSIDDKFIEKCIPIVRESMRLLDIIFFIPITNVSQESIDPKKFRETDIEYIQEIDNIFKAMYQSSQDPESPYFPKDDRPAMIEIFGSPEERIQMMSLYVNEDGNMFGDEDSMVNDAILDDHGMPVDLTDDSQDNRNVYT